MLAPVSLHLHPHAKVPEVPFAQGPSHLVSGEVAADA